MKSIKKILSAMLVLAMALSFTACSKSSDSGESSSASKAPSSSSTTGAGRTESSKTASEASKSASSTASSSASSSSSSTESTASSDSTSSSTDNSSSEATETPAPAAGGVYEDECRNILPTYLDIIDQFEADSCGATYDTSTYYVGVYASEDDRTNQVIESIIPESEATDDMITDGGSGEGGYFCLVTNASSNEELRERMSAYMTSDCLDQHYVPLQEYNGQLYLRRGGRDYDIYDFDASTAILTYTADNCYTADVDASCFGETVGTLTVNMEKIDGNWYITSYSLNV